MRVRRHFQPSLDVMPMRLAPSGVGVIVSPTDPVAGPSSSPTVIISPTDPISGPDGGASVSDPTTLGLGSFTNPPSATMAC